MKYIRFNDSKVDTSLFLQLQDLSTVLSGIPDLEFEYNYGTFIDVIDKKITASHFWDNGDQDVKGIRTENGCVITNDWYVTLFQYSRDESVLGKYP